MMQRKKRWIPAILSLALGTWWVSRGLVHAAAGLELTEAHFTRTAAQRTITLQFSQPPTAVRSFTLSSPTRLVIDVSGAIGSHSPKTISIEDPLLLRLRSAVHERQLRFVIDLRLAEVPKFTVEQQQGQIKAVLTTPGGQSSEPVSQVLFTLPGQRVATLKEPSAVSSAIPPPAVPEVKTQAQAVPAVPSSVGEPKSKSSMLPSPEKEKTAATGEHASLEKPRPVNPIEKSPLQEKKHAASEAVPPPPAASPVPVQPTTESKKGTSEIPMPQGTEKAQTPAPDKPAVSPPQTPQEHFERGQVLYAKGEVEGAMKQWQETLRLAPENAKAHHLMGLVLQQRGEVPEAIASLQEAVRLTPHDAAAHIHLGQALETKGDVEAAQAEYQKALELVPTSAYVYDRLGHLNAAQKKWGETVYAWGETARLRPWSALAQANLGEALEKVGKSEEALVAYERALQLEPQMALAEKIRQRLTQLRPSAP